MINVVTVHWLSPQWIPAQLEYLERNASAPFRVFASLNGIEDESLRKRFYYVQDIEIEDHPEKLNILAQVVIEQSKPEDIIIFLDGDAFPIQPLQPWLEETFKRHPLVAVQRYENCKDTRPHPSFCATTVGFWKELGCDWTPRDWVTETGALFLDAGGKLCDQLSENDVDWLPLRRTNTVDLHQLWYAVYGHKIYHHGAGFRNRVSKVDQVKRPALYKVNHSQGASLGQLSVAAKRNPSLVLTMRPHHVKEVGLAARRTFLRRFTQRFTKKAEVVSDQVFNRVSSDPSFYREFDSTLV
ncbi:MAG: hypothetical protein WAM97_16405 [Acidimicrobiales bacterium]